MAALAHPYAEDVIISRRSPTTLTISVSSGTPQVLCGTFEEALRRAGSLASERAVSVWFTADNRKFVPLVDEQLLRRIWCEYLEMPGLRLTSKQAQRLWAVDERTCAQLLGSLVDARLLTLGADGMYARLHIQSSPGRMAGADIARASPSVRHAS